MTKEYLINKDDYFTESKKVIEMVLNKEESFSRDLPAKDELRLLKQSKDETTSHEEYDAICKREKELELNIRFNKLNEPAIPTDQHKKIKLNTSIEELQLSEKLNELKAELEDKISYVETDLIPLVHGIRELESMKSIPNKVGILLDSEIGENVVAPIRYRLRLFNKTSDETESGKALINLYKVVGALKEIHVPVETKGLMDFLRGGKK